MCGYCIETGVVLPFIESGTRCGQHYRASFLQEGNNLIEEIKRIDGFNNVPLFIDIVFCRLFERYITEGFDASLANQISSTISIDAIHSFLARGCDEELWTHLSDESIYRDENCWNAFIGNKHILELSLATLESYCDWWIAGDGKEKGNSDQRMEETGIMDPIEDTTPCDWDQFYNLFPLVSFSLSLVTQFDSGHDIIKKIALGSPHDVPGFEGNDLWLRRRALLTCVDRYGTRFILNHLTKLSSEQIYYVLLRMEIKSNELDCLRKAILSVDEHPTSIMMEPEYVVELIDRLLTRQDEA